MKTLKSKIGILLSLAIVSVLTITVYTGYKDYKNIIDFRKAEVQKQVESAYNIIDGYQQLEMSGKMSKEEAQKSAKQAIKMARYGGENSKSEYFYIFDYETGVTIMHPIKTEWDGVKYAADIKTSNGILVIVDMINALKKSSDNKTFVATMFPRPGQTEAVDKLQYVRGIEGWNWMIGSGIYMDDIKSLVIDSLITTLIVDAVILLLIVVFGVYIVKNVLKQVGGEPHEAIEVMKKIAGGNLNISIPTNEKESLLYSMNEMVKSLAQIVSQTKSSTQEIAIAANEIAQGNMELSSRTEQTAAFLQETAASMNEIASSIASSTSSANEANSLSSEANRMAEQGGKVMG